MATGPFVDIEASELNHLDPKTAQTLCALGEAFIGADFSQLVDFKRFVLDVDDLMNYQKPETREGLKTGLRAIQSMLLRAIGLWLWPPGWGHFTDFSLEKRQSTLQRLKDGSRSNQREFYLGFNNLICSSFYGDPGSWAELQYQGVSVDNQCVLQGHRWRPDDPRPVEKCDPAGPC